jgi:gas vesicle protein
MDPTPIGAAIGAAVATFLATWRGLVTPLKRRLDTPQEPPKALMERIATLEAQAAEALRRLDDHSENLDTIEDRLNRTVSSEEFAAQSSNTANTLQTLAEKIGQAKGAIEVWLSSDRRIPR